MEWLSSKLNLSSEPAAQQAAAADTGSSCNQQEEFKQDEGPQKVGHIPIGASTGTEVPEIKRCNKVHACGHACNGVEEEHECLPCQDPACGGQGNEICAICYTSDLSEESCVQLGCGHVFHANCILSQLKHRWSTLKISFGFMACPQCKQEITEVRCPKISAELDALKELRRSVAVKALEAAENQGLNHSERLTTRGD